MLFTRVPVALIFVSLVVWGCSSGNSRTSYNFPSFSTGTETPTRRAPSRRRRMASLDRTGGGYRPSLAVEERACLAAGTPSRFSSVSARSSLGGPFSACGAQRAFLMRAAAGGEVALQPAATLRCPMIPAVDRWVRDVVDPAARRYLGRGVTGIKVIASYSCRTRNGIRGARLSEHGRANAVDVSAFQLAGGGTVKVKTGWHAWGGERRFLRAVHRGGCRIFTTVLGPDADRYHHDHFHLDLARHGRKGTYRVCR